MKHKKHYFLILGLLFSGCSVGPNYVRPLAESSEVYKEANPDSEGITWKVAEPGDDFNAGNWWEIFNDSKLNELEEILNAANFTIINAEANYRQSRALVDEARAAYYPTISGLINGTREKRSKGAASATSSGTISASTSPIQNITNLQLDATWEVDIWGATRRAVEASIAFAQSEYALYAFTRLSSQASLAQYYFELRALDTDQKILDETVEDYKKSLRITKNQYRSGIVNEADVLAAVSLLESAEAQAINNGILRQQYEHAIAVLLGVPPAIFQIRFQPLDTVPPIIPLEIPSALLERRPDVAQAERLMAQANAQIGVAVAAYFPTLVLTPDIGLTGVAGVKLLSRAAYNWLAEGQGLETFFDGGNRKGVLTAARATYDANVANYFQVLLTAFQNVEDSLVALRLLDKQQKVLDEAAIAAERSRNIYWNQYKSGIVDYTTVFTAEIAAFAARKNAADNIGLRMTAAVGLIKALGGGWDAAELESIGKDITFPCC
jgi:NodT family efflux transporter outer membrane factor (OMF) lipoprotein